jgi:hypothetical protein
MRHLTLQSSMQKTSDIMDITGQTIGQYRIIEPIGVGGMATVFKAYQPGLDRDGQTTIFIQSQSLY